MTRNYCADPFKRHKTKISRQVRLASKSLIDQVNDPRLKEGDYLCIDCKVRLTKRPKSLPVEESLVSQPQSDSGSQDEDHSAPSADTSLSEVEVNRQITEDVLPLLGVSPLTTSK